ncbi:MULTISPECIES: DEK C-terminal domain-containing protein [Clostridia]|uniref:DEK C-terminal domain-containing protein n=1 Tax=Clostridia TaxID=186801 RepID=UPI00067F0972|nr:MULTISPECIES: DEK C-terminal domain-containing protein [Clostridia]
MKKRILGISLILVMLLSIVGCSKPDASDKSSGDNVTLKAEKNLFDVEITLPASLVGDSDDTLDEEAKAAGVKEIVKNANGSITLKMTKRAHQQLLSDYKDSIDDGIDEILKDKENYPSFNSISYNDDLTEFTIKVNPDTYNEIQGFVALVFYIEGNIYQALSAVPEDQLITIVNFVDKNTGNIIEHGNSSETESSDIIDESETTSQEQPTTPPQQEIDMTGDYIGNIACPLPPVSSTYKIHNLADINTSIVLHVENIDDANFSFYITKAVLNEDGNVSEDIIFLEHIAHYNGAGFYEFIGEQYHLYFKFNSLGDIASYKVMEIYGLEPLYIPSEYNETMQYNGITGNLFRMGYPGVG